jgi:hypothetical protein
LNADMQEVPRPEDGKKKTLFLNFYILLIIIIL